MNIRTAAITYILEQIVLSAAHRFTMETAVSSLIELGCTKEEIDKSLELLYNEIQQGNNDAMSKYLNAIYDIRTKNPVRVDIKEFTPWEKI